MSQVCYSKLYEKLPEEIEYIVGIDEVGRGPLAGPVTLGFAIMSVKNLAFLSGDITDSKLLTPKKREALNGEMNRLKKKGLIDLFTKSQTALFVDKNGISQAIKSCIKEGFNVIGERYKKNIVIFCLMVGFLLQKDTLRKQS